MNLSPSTKLINFLNAAYKVPDTVLFKLLDKFDSVDDRNFANLEILMVYYLCKRGELSLAEMLSKSDPLAEFNKLLKEKSDDIFNAVLAEAVMLTYQD